MNLLLVFLRFGVGGGGYTQPHSSLDGLSSKAQTFFLVLLLAVIIGFWWIVKDVKKKK